MTKLNNNSWFSYNKKQDKEFGPFATAIEALAASLEPDIVLSRGSTKTETTVDQEASPASGDQQRSFPCDVIPRTRDYSSYS